MYTIAIVASCWGTCDPERASERARTLEWASSMSPKGNILRPRKYGRKILEWASSMAVKYYLPRRNAIPNMLVFRWMKIVYQSTRNLIMFQSVSQKPHNIPNGVPLQGSFCIGARSAVRLIFCTINHFFVPSAHLFSRGPT